MQTRLRRATEADLSQVAGWFATPSGAQLWGGPKIRFPLQVEQLKEDIGWDEAEAFALVNATGELLGFGQVMNKFGCRHLGRIAVAPHQRGNGLGCRLVSAIVQAAAVPDHDFSLFVYEENHAARRLYERLGFERQPSPRNPPPADNLFMVKAMSR